MIMMKSKKVKTVVSVDGDNIHTQQATTSSDIVSIGQPVSWKVIVIQIAKKFNLKVPNF